MIKVLRNLKRKTTSYYIREIAKDIKTQGHYRPEGDYSDSYHGMLNPSGSCGLINNPTLDGLGPLQYQRCARALKEHFDGLGIGLQAVSDALPTDLLLASLEVLAQSLEEE